jgi:hypothetical protein
MCLGDPREFHSLGPCAGHGRVTRVSQRPTRGTGRKHFSATLARLVPWRVGGLANCGQLGQPGPCVNPVRDSAKTTRFSPTQRNWISRSRAKNPCKPADHNPACRGSGSSPITVSRLRRLQPAHDRATRMARRSAFVLPSTPEAARTEPQEPESAPPRAKELFGTRRNARGFSLRQVDAAATNVSVSG